MLQTERLLLRPPSPEDLARVFHIYSDPATNTFNPLGPCADIATAATILSGFIGHWQEFGFGHWMLATRAQPRWVIGVAGLSRRRYGQAEVVNLGYRFAPEAWGQGFATEVSREALRHAFQDLALADVCALVRPDHRASIRVLEKIGMQPDGVLDDVPGQAPSLRFRARSDRT